MKCLDIYNIIFLTISVLITSCQYKHARYFMGASKTMGPVLAIYSLIGIGIEIFMLIFYGIKVSWWSPIVLMIYVILPFGVISAIIQEISFHAFTYISLIGIIVLPVSLYLFFRTIPIEGTIQLFSAKESVVYIVYGILCFIFGNGIFKVSRAAKVKDEGYGLWVGSAIYFITGILLFIFKTWWPLVISFPINHFVQRRFNIPDKVDADFSNNNDFDPQSIFEEYVKEKGLK